MQIEEQAMDIKNLTTFIYAAELGSFTKAAETLGYSQSTVSFQIKQLETELDAQLFERVGHTISLTEKGREALAYAQQVSKLTHELQDSMQEEQIEKATGRVRIRIGFAQKFYYEVLSQLTGADIK